MTKETLEKAKNLTDSIANAKAHKLEVLKRTNDLKDIKISVRQHNDSNYDVQLWSRLFVIAPDRQMRFYMDELDKYIAQLEAELAAL